MRQLPFPRLLALLSVTISLLGAGCIGDDEPTPAADSPDPDPVADTSGGSPVTAPAVDTGAEVPTAPAGDACASVSEVALASWTHDATQLPFSSGSVPFDLAGVAERLVVSGQAADFVSPNWTVRLTDPAGTELFSIEGTGADAGSVTGPATGEGGTRVLAEVLLPLPGTYSIGWDVTGYVDGLTVTVTGVMCQAA